MCFSFVKKNKNWKTNYYESFFEFLKEYQKQIKAEHQKWLIEDRNVKEEKEKDMKACLFYVDEQKELPLHISEHNLDLQYLLFNLKNRNVRGINPAIKRVLIDYYFTPSLKNPLIKTLISIIGVDMVSTLKNILR